MYLTLNLARVLAYAREGLILSKKEGGEWALENLPEKYHSLIRDALQEYIEAAIILYNQECIRDYAEYMLNEIETVRDKKHTMLSS